jgi:hypothetical protein
MLRNRLLGHLYVDFKAVKLLRILGEKMNLDPDPPTQCVEWSLIMTCCIRLDYLLDTFLGPIAKSVECEALIIPITPGAFQVQVQAPFPQDLHQAHTVTVFRPSKQPLTGTLVHARRLANGDLELQIDV